VSQSAKNPPTGTNLNIAYAAYVEQLNRQEESPQSINLEAFEYQAKARSRQLDTLLHLSQFSDYLVLISAPPGAGKTTFIEQFLRVQPAGACIVHLVLQESVNAPWVVRQLVQQLPVQLPNHASLEVSILALQELAQELTLQKEVLLLVVDNAQWLDEDALELLANLLPRSAQIDSRPHVILCADHSVVERIEAPQFAELRQERFYHLVLAPFNQEESADYLRQRLQRIGLNHALAPIQLLQLHQLAKGNPGYLNMLANKALNKGGLVQQTGLPLWHIGATIIVVAILAGIWWFNNAAVAVTGQDELQPDPAITSLELAPVSATPLSVVAPIASMAQALPPLEPIQLSPASQNITLEPKLETTPKIKPVAKSAPKITQTPKPQVEAILSGPVLAAWPKATTVTKQPYSYEAVLKLPNDHYSLQVLGARLETTLEAFIKAQALVQPYYIIALERGGNPWYMVLVGDYTSSKDARGAISSLPVALQNQQPWPRPMVKIQQQIRNKFNTSGD
jgi:DamX protein|tara:strand:- start:639 stop:2165 length:1527 start_codon:yes stop_codon:yes gene_type:complete